ncbi:NAD(+)/NADH kinase [Silvanigrella aquatica]|uniref:NAD(+) kinase n=1 Tax=Silvanigrella aquatica TaxID=1915309 RepID=A0A1L4D1T0_9BACT|nr:NAD(+)/NADH kinase [Silvanigrella aquatica]APJ04152.1 hypothetical protein AXG55_09640 [Silvanigrella aquatica]
MQSEVDVYIIQKQTTLERYTKRTLNVDFFDYLERDKQNPVPLQEAHKEHLKSRKILIKALEKHSLSYKIFNLDEISENNFCYFSDKCEKSGLNPKKKLVISLGGDGTLLHASHHVGGDVCLLGINSCPEHSVGHMCPIVPKYIEQAIDCFVNHKFKTTSVRRIKLEVSRKQILPLALNDVLLCNRHPAATSRYQISICSHNEQKEIESEKQLSSGLWVSTSAGSTAAISCYGFEKASINSSNMFVAVREPYTPRNENLSLQKFSLNGDEKSLLFFSRMRQGLVCVDGPDSCGHLGFGDTVHMSLPDECSIKLILDFLGKVPTFPFDKPE